MTTENPFERIEELEEESRKLRERADNIVEHVNLLERQLRSVLTRVLELEARVVPDVTPRMQREARWWATYNAALTGALAHGMGTAPSSVVGRKVANAEHGELEAEP